jgi:hypothetical protein
MGMGFFSGFTAIPIALFTSAAGFVPGNSLCTWEASKTVSQAKADMAIS